MTDVFDAGCGQGLCARRLAIENPWLRIVAADLLPPDTASSDPSNLQFRRVDLTQWEENGKYDLIYSIDVLEHIRGNRPIFARFHRALRTEGYLYVHMPCDRAEKRILPQAWFSEFKTWADAEHVGEQYDSLQLRAVLAEVGFTILAAGYTFGRLGRLAWEMDRITDSRRRLKILIMPFLKALAWVSAMIPHRSGSVFAVAVKR